MAVNLFTSDNHGYREARLCRVLEHPETAHLQGDICSLEDHEGNLTITWLREPKQAEREAFEAAWEDQNESALSVRHEVTNEGA